MPEISSDDINQIAEQITCKLVDQKRALWVDAETHHQDHEWVKLKRLDEEEYRAFRRKVIQSASVWALIIVLGFVASVFWDYFLEVVRK
jgi:hypothetical protein